METVESKTLQVSTGVSQLDRFLGQLYPGDNVVWQDVDGSLALPFCQSFVSSSQAARRPLIYVTFTTSPGKLLEQLGPCSHDPYLTIIDCFTWGKGGGSDAALSFYYEDRQEYPGRVVRVDAPARPDLVSETLWGTYSSLDGDVRLVFDSLSAMQELWGAEDSVWKFYSASCPKLYELQTVSYWLARKDFHSEKFRHKVAEMAQVVVDLSVRRGRSFLTTLKADRRSPPYLNMPLNYWVKAGAITFEEEHPSPQQLEIGLRLKEARTLRGLSQNELARLVGVTPSSISQIEGNTTYPSLHTLLKMAEVLSVEPGFFFKELSSSQTQTVFPAAEAKEITLPQVPREGIVVRAVTPFAADFVADIYIVEFQPRFRLASHFLKHKGTEIGCLISGKLQVSIGKTVRRLRPGDVLYLTSDIPEHWENIGPAPARLLWLKVS